MSFLGAGLVILNLLATTRGSAARLGPPPILDPKRYESPSARYTLEVDPSDPQGKGPARYRLSLEGKEVWSAERPFTFWDAVVTDDGEAAGFAYSLGIRGIGDSDEFVIAIFGADGEVRARHASPRKWRQPEGPSRPSAAGLFLDPTGQRLVVRVEDNEARSRESWWSFRWSDGTVIDRIDPALSVDVVGESSRLRGARPLGGTPLVLVHWMRGLRDGVFALMDADHKPVWVLELPGDYARPSEGAPQDRMWSWVRQGQAISVGGSSGYFEVRSLSRSTRTGFKAAADPGSETGWRIREIGGEPYSVSFEDPPAPSFPTVRLRELGRVVLASGSERPPHPIHDVFAFDFDEEGRFEVIRRSEDADRSVSWCLVDRSGQLLAETEFPRFGSTESGRFHWLRISSERWLVTESGFGKGAIVSGWWAGSRSGKVEAIEGFDCPPVESLARDPKGGFVVLGQVQWEYGMTPILTSFGPDARPRWSLGRERLNDPRVPQEPGSLFSPEAIAVTADGSTLVLDNIRKTLQLFGSTGAFLRTISLEEAWGEAKYPVHLIATTGGSIFVHDSGGNGNSIWRMDLDGGPATRIELRHADGHKPAPHGGSLRVAPDGRLWTKDGQMLERVGPDGAIDEIVGNAPGPDSSSEIEDPFVDSLGRILTLDRRNRIVQAFDREGRLLARGQFDATDEIGREPFTDAGDGSILVRVQDSQYVRFDAEGARVGREKLSTEPQGHRCYFQPRTKKRWVLAGYVGRIVDWGEGVEGSGTKPLVSRRPDGRWLRNIQSVVVGEDGTLFVKDGATTGPPDVPSSISIYPPDGSQGRTIDLPAYGLGSDLSVLTDWFAIGAGREIYLVERAGKKLVHVDFGTPEDKNKWVEPFASPDGRELWVVEPPTRALVRYALP
jgi:hypothetical protein